VACPRHCRSSSIPFLCPVRRFIHRRDQLRRLDRPAVPPVVRLLTMSASGIEPDRAPAADEKLRTRHPQTEVASCAVRLPLAGAVVNPFLCRSSAASLGACIGPRRRSDRVAVCGAQQSQPADRQPDSELAAELPDPGVVQPHFGGELRGCLVLGEAVRLHGGSLLPAGAFASSFHSLTHEPAQQPGGGLRETPRSPCMYRIRCPGPDCSQSARHSCRHRRGFAHRP